MDVSIIIIGLLVLTAASRFMTDKQQHGWIWALKRLVNIHRMWLHLLAGVYAIIIAVQPLPWLVERSLELAADSSSVFGAFMLNRIPAMYALFVIIGFFWILYKGNKVWWHYTAKEQVWLQESHDKFHNKLPVWARRFVGKKVKV